MGAVFIVLWVVFAAAGYAIGKSKGRASLGFVLGLLLGLIGIIIIACLKPVATASSYNYGGPTYGQAGGPTPAGSPPAAQWLQDPSGRHQSRWWSGTAWTDHVADNGVTSTDSLSTPNETPKQFG